MKTDPSLLSIAAAASVLVLSLLFTAPAQAEDNSPGGSGFGATCEDAGEGDGRTKTCSCTPPQTSSDCQKLLDRCDTEYVKHPYPDGTPNRQLKVPKAICTATQCVCKWIGREVPSSRFKPKMRWQKSGQPVVAPTADPVRKPARASRFNYMKPSVADTEGKEEEDLDPAATPQPASNRWSVMRRDVDAAEQESGEAAEPEAGEEQEPQDADEATPPAE